MLHHLFGLTHRFFSIQISWKKPKLYQKNIRLTLDYREDYIIIKKIFDNLYKKNKYFTLEQILKFLKKNKKITNINKKYINLQWKKFHSKRTIKRKNKQN